MLLQYIKYLNNVKNMQTKFNMNSIILSFKWWIIEFIVNFVCMFLWN